MFTEQRQLPFIFVGINVANQLPFRIASGGGEGESGKEGDLWSKARSLSWEFGAFQAEESFQLKPLLVLIQREIEPSELQSNYWPWEMEGETQPAPRSGGKTELIIAVSASSAHLEQYSV